MKSVLPGWFPLVSKNLCHRRGVRGLKKIMEAGAILPNDGSFPGTYFQSARSLARANNCISLFDLSCFTEDQAAGKMHHWYKFFHDRPPVTVVILLARDRLAGKLITNEEVSKTADLENGPVYIPRVEAFYPEPIPVDFFVGCILICSADERIFEYIPGRGANPDIFRKIERFLKEHEKVYLDPFGRLEKEWESFK